jgi:hypothetical protein
MSIDDPLSKIIPAMIASDSDLSITEVARARAKIWDNEPKKNKYSEGWAKFKEYTDRLIVKDATDGTSVVTMEKYIKFYKKANPDKHIVLILDNFHKLTDYMNSKERYSMMSNKIKQLTTVYESTIIMTLELRKGSDFDESSPSLFDVKDSVGIQYDCDILMLMHQELHLNRNSKKYFRANTPWEPSVKMPFVEIEFAKNKESGFKDILYFKFFTHKSQFTPSTKEEVGQFADNNRKYDNYEKQIEQPPEVAAQPSGPAVQPDLPLDSKKDPIVDPVKEIEKIPTKYDTPDVDF